MKGNFPLLKNISHLKLSYLFSTEPFRVKHIESGLCWENKDGNIISATSKCKDVFQFQEDSIITHLATGLELRNSASYELTILNNGGYRFVMRDRTIMKMMYTADKFCVFEENGQVKITTSPSPITPKSCENDTRSHVKILPGEWQWISRLSITFLRQDILYNNQNLHNFILHL